MKVKKSIPRGGIILKSTLKSMIKITVKSTLLLRTISEPKCGPGRASGRAIAPDRPGPTIFT